MMGDNRPAAFADDRRVRDFLRVAHFHDVPDDVARVFVQRVIRGAVESRARAIVIHAEPAADIEITEFVSELAELGVKARRLTHRALDRADVRHLRTHVKMHELERVGEPFAFQQFARRHQFRRADAKFRVLSTARRPFPRTLRREAHANADHRFHAHLLGNAQNLGELLDLLHHEDDLFAELAAEQRVLDEELVLVAVADDERFRIAMNGQRRNQLRFAACLDAKMVGRTRVHDLLHDFAQLVHLNREDAAIFVAVVRLLHRRDEGLVDRLDTIAQQILEAQHERKSEPARLRLVDQFHDVDIRRPTHRMHLDIPAVVDRKIARPPTVDIVEGNGGGDIPRLLHWRG